MPWIFGLSAFSEWGFFEYCSDGLDVLGGRMERMGLSGPTAMMMTGQQYVLYTYTQRVLYRVVACPVEIPLFFLIANYHL